MKNPHQSHSKKPSGRPGQLSGQLSGQPSFEREKLLTDEDGNEEAFEPPENASDKGDIADKILAPTILGALNQCFDRRASSRGLTYSRTRRVVDFNFDRKTKIIQAQIRGSAPEPYQTSVTLSDDCKKVLSTCCTCPIKFDCKHAAAALWSAYGAMQKGGKNSFIAGNDPALLLDASKINSQLRTGLEKIAAIIGTGQKTPESSSRGGAETLVPKVSAEHSQVVYVLRQDVHGRLVVDALKAFIKADGTIGRTRDLEIYSPFDSRLRTLDPQDSVIVRLMADAYLAEESRSMGGLPTETSLAETIINLILATGRAYWGAVAGPKITAGGTLAGELAWIEDLDGRFRLRPRSIALERKLKTFSGSRFYIDEKNGQLGGLAFDPPVPPSVFDIIDNLAAANKDEIQAVRTLLDATGMPPVIPRPEGTRETELRLIQPVPCLWLETKKLPQGTVDIAAFSLNYPDNLNEKHPERFYEEDATGKLVVERIDGSFKAKAKKVLHDLGFSIIQNPQDFGLRGGAIFLHAHDDATWMRFVCRDRGRLEEQGWEIVADSSFQRQIIFTEEDASDWGVSVEQEGSVWFEIELGIMVDGRRVSLLPFLEKAIRALGPEAKPEDIEASCIDGKFLCPTEKGTILALPYERVKDILQYVFDLDKQIGLKKGKLRLPIGQANEFSKKSTVIPCTGDGAMRLRQFDERLKQFDGLDDDQTPSNFKGLLRDYQKRGVAWLQFLREFRLGGILADDMGLGKTVQALAHICLEKEHGRLDKPFLIVCPVSVYPNWIDEAKKFAPHLTILPHRGAGREHNFYKASDYDIVMTTYSILTRDAALLSTQQWSGVFLDEAQAIKNGGTRNKKAAMLLDATHKVCLTGTPVENNLGELWSLMDFTMPDILGPVKAFNNTYRAPIEKRHDKQKQQRLANLLSPFLVRRTKETVAPELPEKTVIIHKMKLSGGQRDLYEAVRLSSLNQVKEAIQAKGLAKSHMIILTAMLRLRQVCCDPRLLGIGDAGNLKESVKLDALMELTLPLVEEGRRILIFSQFTSMLDIIVEELKQYNISFVEIRGETKDRRTPVNLFQTGMVPVFLISLKAGGTGLNLTAADTVIHYDPWWNPAVEDQATDRAHRIGQNKPVFVYKLVTTETIEDRMYEMQEKKRLLYQAILDGDKNAKIAFTEKDLDLLFAPISQLLDFGEDG